MEFVRAWTWIYVNSTVLEGRG